MSETNEVTLERPGAGPGRRLAAERQAQGLALEQVAGQLRLSLQVLKALENDDYKQLPPAAFVVGYLRSYARLLGLPEQELVDAYSTAGRTTPAVVARSQRPQARAGDLPIRMISYLVFGGLLALSGVWFMTQREEAPAEAPEIAQPEPAAEQVIADDLPLQLAEPELVEAPPAEEAADGGADATAVMTPGETLTQAADALAPAVPVAPPPAAPAVPEKAKKPAAPPLAPGTPQSKLVVEFSGDCWTQISDAAGRQLENGLVKGGRTLTLRGEAPFRVFFGYAPAAKISLNGELFDHRPYQRENDVARFRLGSAGDNAPRTE